MSASIMIGSVVPEIPKRTGSEAGLRLVLLGVGKQEAQALADHEYSVLNMVATAVSCLYWQVVCTAVVFEDKNDQGNQVEIRFETKELCERFVALWPASPNRKGHVRWRQVEIDYARLGIDLTQPHVEMFVSGLGRGSAAPRGIFDIFKRIDYAPRVAHPDVSLEPDQRIPELEENDFVDKPRRAKLRCLSIQPGVIKWANGTKGTGVKVVFAPSAGLELEQLIQDPSRWSHEYQRDQPLLEAIRTEREQFQTSFFARLDPTLVRLVEPWPANEKEDRLDSLIQHELRYVPSSLCGSVTLTPQEATTRRRKELVTAVYRDTSDSKAPKITHLRLSSTSAVKLICKDSDRFKRVVLCREGSTKERSIEVSIVIPEDFSCPTPTSALLANLPVNTDEGEVDNIIVYRRSSQRHAVATST